MHGIAAGIAESFPLALHSPNGLPRIRHPLCIKLTPVRDAASGGESTCLRLLVRRRRPRELGRKVGQAFSTCLSWLGEPSSRGKRHVVAGVPEIKKRSPCAAILLLTHRYTRIPLLTSGSIPMTGSFAQKNKKQLFTASPTQCCRYSAALGTRAREATSVSTRPAQPPCFIFLRCP